MSLEFNAIFVYPILSDMRDAVRFTAGTIARLSIRSSGMHTSIKAIEHQQNILQTRSNKDIVFPY
jgi:hypothetical protein